MKEIAFIAALIVWISLFWIEKLARKRRRLSKYAWLGRALKQLTFFSAIGLFLLLEGTDWNNRPWEIGVGITFISIGLVLSALTFVSRNKIQNGLKRGTIKPISGEG